MNNALKLGKAVRAERERLGFSQEDFADMCSLHRTYIGSVERGERNVSIDNIIKISKALGIKAADLLKKAGL